MDCGKQKLIYRPPYKLEVFILVRFKNKRMLLDFLSLKTDNEIKNKKSIDFFRMERYTNLRVTGQASETCRKQQNMRL